MKARDFMPSLYEGHKILPSDILGGGGLGIGNVYYVVPTNATYYTQFVNDYNVRYEDGSESVVPCNMAAADVDIQIALDRTVALRNDYVVLLPSEGNYELTATLTMTKKAVHLVGSGNMATIGCMNTVRLDARGLAFHAITTSSGGIEIAGIYINTATDYYGIYITDGTVSGYGMNIHHNRVHVYTTGTGTGGGIVCYGGAAGGYSTFDHNVIMVGTGAASAAVAGISVPNGTYPIITNNYVMVQNGCTVVTGIVARGTGGLVADNILHERQVQGASTAGVFSYGISLSDSALAVGNRIGMVTVGNAIYGGVEDVSGVQNFQSALGGTVFDVSATG